MPNLAHGGIAVVKTDAEWPAPKSRTIRNAAATGTTPSDLPARFPLVGTRGGKPETRSDERDAYHARQWDGAFVIGACHPAAAVRSTRTDAVRWTRRARRAAERQETRYGRGHFN